MNPSTRSGSEIIHPLALSIIVSSVALSFLSCSASIQDHHDFGPTTESGLKTPHEFKVLTYNVFHGLNVGKFWVTRGESLERNQGRFQLQIQQLVKAQPDLIFLQEVNPLPERAKAYTISLKEFGLEYSQIHQVDACGWRLSKNVALIKELNNGLVIMGKSGLVLREIEGLKLSGPGECHDTWGIQFGELRYGLIGEVTWPGTDHQVLLVNVHLHSGIESDGVFLKALMESHQEGRLHHYVDLKSELFKDQSERLQELVALSKELDHLLAKKSYGGVIIAGDFNFEKGSPGYKEVVALGAVNTANLSKQETMIETLDPEEDPLAREDAHNTDDLIDVIDDEMPGDQKEILADYQENLDRPRKVDFIFILPIQSNFPLKNHCVTQEVFGRETDASGLAGSDHFGALITYWPSEIHCKNS